MKKLTRDQMLHNVNNIPVIGYTFALQMKQAMYKRSAVISSAERYALDTPEGLESAFPEPTKRNSFKNALRKQSQKSGSDKILHFVEENETGIIYQVDTKVILESTLSGDSSDGGEAVIESKVATYQSEYKIVFDKTSDRIVCDNSEVLGAIYKLLGIYQKSYTKATITRYVLSLLAKNTSFAPYIKGTGVYFVPSHQRDYMTKVMDFMHMLDNEDNTIVCEIPDTTNARKAVAVTTTEMVEQLSKNLEKEIMSLVEDSAELSVLMMDNRIEAIEKTESIVEEYEILLKMQRNDLKAKTKASKLLVKTYRKYNVIENPFQKMIDGMSPELKANAEAIAEFKEELPEEFKDLLAF